MGVLRWILHSLILKLVLSLLVVFVLYDFTVCTGITFDRPYTPLDVGSLRGDGSIRFVPLESFPSTALEPLAGYYRNKYKLPVEVASALPLPDAAFDRARKQFKADAVLDALQARHPQAGGQRLIVIGFLNRDMYIPGVNWNYAISFRRPDRYAVVSRAQLDRGCLGIVRASEERTMSRLRKMVTKNIGIFYYRLHRSDDPRSVLYDKIGGSQEFDRMSEDF
jgi:predicted Zn-dependent protease